MRYLGRRRVKQRTQTSGPAMSDCTMESHDELRKDRDAYEEATEPMGWQELIHKGQPSLLLELRRCKTCRSSLSDGTRRKAEEKAA